MEPTPTYVNKYGFSCECKRGWSVEDTKDAEPTCPRCGKTMKFDTPLAERTDDKDAK